MECVQGALKSSFISLNNHHQNQLSVNDDLTAVNSLPCDDLFVDGLLDFSDAGDFEAEQPPTPQPQNDNTLVVFDTNNDGETTPISPANQTTTAAATTTTSLTDLLLPADDVAELEWVSHFVDDSFSGGYSLTCPAVKVLERKPKPEPESFQTGFEKPNLTTPVHTKARSKRARTGGRVWSLGSNPLTDSSTSSSSSTSCTSNPWVFYQQECTQTAESIFGKSPVHKPRKKKSSFLVGTMVPVRGPVHVPVQSQPPRRCSHCHVQKTPQWRAGPLGAKTLCNACGVRFKSGRLLPEYRPACSPTFSSEMHSNNHRKVLEMRQKKEAGLTYPVRSF
uniref:GATA transcription factor 6-like n=1 Tax=Erigeron canadensis TaxID=72917 RepID=UPI001CB8EB60|nr:GATA transcription factor 6-like [Erigeron canadensis]